MSEKFAIGDKVHVRFKSGIIFTGEIKYITTAGEAMVSHGNEHMTVPISKLKHVDDVTNRNK